MNDAIKNLIEQTETLGGNVEAYIEGELRAESDPRLYDSIIGAKLELHDALWNVIKLLETLSIRRRTMTSNLKQTNGWAHNGVFYTTEREALLSALTTEEDYPVNKATLYSDGSVLVMNNANVVIDRFVDRFTKLTPTKYETEEGSND